MTAQRLTGKEIGQRFLLAALLTTIICLPLATLFLYTTGVPLSYPPLLPQQIIFGTVGGAGLCALGYLLLNTVFTNARLRHIVFIAAGVLLMIASYYLPYRLTYTTSTRFEGWTIPALIAQGVLHTIVVLLSIACFIRSDKPVC